MQHHSSDGALSRKRNIADAEEDDNESSVDEQSEPVVKKVHGDKRPEDQSSSTTREVLGQRPQPKYSPMDYETRLLNRQWLESEFGNCSDDGQEKSKDNRYMEFKMATYNVLAQNLLEDNIYLYGHCKSETLMWAYRRDRLLRELVLHQPDILCCQEIKENHFEEFFLPSLEQFGYKGHFKKRTRQMQDGCATFYKTSVFECESVTPVEYFRPNVAVLDRDNVGLVLMLKPRDSGDTDTRLCIANTHLLFNPRRGDIKLAQLMMLFAEIDRIAFRHERPNAKGVPEPVYQPILFCGDLNMEPFCHLYRFVSSGWLPIDGIDVRKMSGQKEARRSSSDLELSPTFLDPRLGITDSSQYVEVCREREGCRCRRAEVVSESGEPAVGEGNADDDDEVIFQCNQGSGTLTHPFNFRSVYRHYTDYGQRQYSHRVREVTTSHSRANCTVDYIFYATGVPDDMVDGPRDSPIRLLASLELLSDQEMQQIGGLPNETISSDHLILSAKFALKIDDPKSADH